MDSLIIIIIILAVFLLLFVLLYLNEIFTTINPKDCPTAYGQFGVIPSTSSAPLFSCNSMAGTGTGTQICQFQATTLESAVGICLSYSFCDAFTYNSSIQQMTIVRKNDTYTRSNGTDLYLKQTPS